MGNQSTVSIAFGEWRYRNGSNDKGEGGGEGERGRVSEVCAKDNPAFPHNHALIALHCNAQLPPSDSIALHCSITPRNCIAQIAVPAVHRNSW